MPKNVLDNVYLDRNILPSRSQTSLCRVPVAAIVSTRVDNMLHTYKQQPERNSYTHKPNLYLHFLVFPFADVLSAVEPGECARCRVCDLAQTPRRTHTCWASASHLQTHARTHISKRQNKVNEGMDRATQQQYEQQQQCLMWVPSPFTAPSASK